MLRWDRQLENWIVAHRASGLDGIFRWLTYIGTWGAVWLVLAALAAVWWRRPGVLLWVAVADGLAQLATSLLKLAIPRHRPRVHTLVAEPHTHSFPSGHAASSFACAYVLAAAAPRFRISLYVLATAIAFSRAYVGVHYPLDVLVGSLFGLALGYRVVAAARRVTAGSRSSSGSRVGL